MEKFSTVVLVRVAAPAGADPQPEPPAGSSPLLIAVVEVLAELEPTTYNGKPQRTNLSRISINGARLARAKFAGVNLSGAQLRGVDLSDADLADADLSGADLSDANFSNCNLHGAKFATADLSGARLVGAELIGVALDNANLAGVDLAGADILSSGFRGANLTDADFSRANFCPAPLGLDQYLWEGARFTDGTRFPDEFNPVDHGATRIETTKLASPFPDARPDDSEQCAE